MPNRRKTLLINLYDRLYQSFGPRHWWPADTPFEVAVGAILTQNTAWRNVKKAIARLQDHRLLSPTSMRDVPVSELAIIIRPSGYYNLKARRLKAFVSFLFNKANGSMTRLMAEELHGLRKSLLSVHGIGPETADSILLYGGNHPTFVIDAYTKRILFRHRLISQEMTYDETRDFFMDCLPADAALFNEYHALLVHLGHVYCLKNDPQCSVCPAHGWNRY